MPKSSFVDGDVPRLVETRLVESFITRLSDLSQAWIDGRPELG